MVIQTYFFPANYQKTGHPNDGWVHGWIHKWG